MVWRNQRDDDYKSLGSSWWSLSWGIICCGVSAMQELFETILGVFLVVGLCNLFLFVFGVAALLEQKRKD